MMQSNDINKSKKNSNTLRFTPLGFKFSIDVPFPGRTLPVCYNCKNNFITRDQCRTKECHNDLPWSNAYICITLDSTCTGADGKLLDGPFMVKEGVPTTSSTTPHQYDPGDMMEPMTLICASCLEKRYTGRYCRVNSNHQTLPWSTVYVVLTLKPNAMIHATNTKTDTREEGKKDDTNINTNTETKTHANLTPNTDISKGTMTDTSTTHHTYSK